MMPYAIEEQNGRYCVVKTAPEKETLKCYDDKQSALDYLRALEANVDDAKEQKMMMIMQEEAQYVPLSTSRGKACANCRWFCADDSHCHLVDSYPEPILPTGYCNRWESKPVPEVPEQEPVPVMIVEPPEPEMEMALSPDKEQSILNKLTETIRNVFQKKTGNFAVYKDVNGKSRWIGKFTNNFKDRSREIISEKAIDGYLTRLEYGLVPMPELRLGHIPGSKHGVADDVFAVGNFVVAVGSFDESDFARSCLRYYEKNAARTPMSHGFIHPEWAFKDGVYDVVNIFEVSTLPPPLVAANPYTEFEVADMKQIRPEQLEALALVVGSKEKAESLVAQWSQESEELKAIGVQYKDFADVEAAQTVEKSEETKGDLNEVFLSVIEDLGTTFKLQKAMSDDLAKVKAEVKAEVEQALAPVQKALADAVVLIEALKADRAAAPRIATEDDSTRLDLTPEQEAKLKQQLPESNGFDPFFGDMKVRKS